MMKKRIAKVIYTDDSFDEVANQKPFKTEEGEERWKAFRRYEAQFRDIEKSVLHSIDNDIVEDYAKDYLDLIDSDDCDCNWDSDEKDINDFSDKEIINEISRRFYGGKSLDIVSNLLFERFIKVLAVAEKSELDEMIKNQEVKHNLI
jgi:hypothetical protein